MTTPVVQVVTSGVSWPAIVAAISGGVVGLAGIGSTIWVATRSISAENSRVRLAEKRRTYARFLTACNETIQARMKSDGHPLAGSASTERWAAVSEYGAAIAAVLASASEVRLIAPEE